MSPLLALAERVERMSNSGGIDLVADIYEALGYQVKREPQRGGGVGRFTAAWKWFDPTARRWIAMAHFTSSLDAAMTLVPEGHFWTGGTHPEFGAGMVVAIDQDAEMNAARAATPALALTAACLRALAVIQEKGS